MRRRYRCARGCLLLLLAGFFVAGLCAAKAQEIDTSTARSQVTSTRASAKVSLQRMLLLLQPGIRQQQDLDALLSAQQTPGNSLFHHWLTPQRFADRFAVSVTDVAMVVSWLRSQGFEVAPLPAGRGWIEFSGSVAQVESAFGTHVLVVNSATESTEARYQLAGEIKLPADIQSLVTGLVSLDGSSLGAAVTAPVQLEGSIESLVAETSQSHASALTPSLAASWLKAVSLSLATGAGETIAIPSRSSVRTEDFDAFRKSFGIAEGTLHVQPAGPDPGRTADEPASMLAASWAGVFAPGADILLVPAASTKATDGIDLALAAIVDGALARTVSVGYTSCEQRLSSAHQAFYAALYRQASAEGIAVIAATGDRGAAACVSADQAGPVSSGLAVNGLASTPWNTTVGAVAFSLDAKSLTAWQTSVSDVEAGKPPYATGGGSSQLYPGPAWQSADGVAAHGSATSDVRFLPDVSLPAAAGFAGSRGLAFCYSGSALASGCRLVSAGGSAASAAMFAGVAAQLAQKYGPQGNLAPTLYALSRLDKTTAAASERVFADIAQGSAQLPCVAGSRDCSPQGLIGFASAVGYDSASGLGSVQVQELVSQWPRAQALGTAPVVVEMTTIGGVTYNPSAQIALTAKVLSGSGGTVPTGTVQFYDETSSSNSGTPVTLAADGTATYTESGQFSVGGHNIAAIYSGDSIYAAAESQPVTINIQPSPSSLVVAPSTTTPAAGAAIAVTGTVTATNPGAVAPTGILTVNLDGLPQGTAKLATTGSVTSASVSVTAPTGGSHTIQGTYSGDSNYNNSTSPSVTIVVSKSATVTTLSATPSTITAGTPETFIATIAPLNAVTGTTYVITGTVSFYDSATLLGTATISSNTAVLTGITLSASAAHSITAVYSGDTTYSASTSAAVVLQPVLQPVTVVLTASTAILAPGESVTLTATVTPVNTPALTAEQHPSGYVLFYAGTALVGTQAPVLVGPGYSGVASTFVSHLPAGNYVLTAIYSGDPTYGMATSNSLNLQVEDFTITCNKTNLTIKQGATSTSDVSCAIASLGGLTGPIQVVCEEQNPPQTGAIQCSLTPTIIQGTGNATLTVVTVAGFTAELRPADGRTPHGRHGPPIWPAAGGGIALAFAGLLLSPIGRRAELFRNSRRTTMLLVLLLTGLASTGIGCNSTTALNNNVGTPLGQHTLKITAAADVGTVTVSHYAYVTVNVVP